MKTPKSSFGAPALPGRAAPLRLRRTTRPAVPGVLGDHRAAVRLRHLADDRQPEPGAGHRRGPRPSGRSDRRRAAGPRRRSPARGRAPAARRRRARPRPSRRRRSTCRRSRAGSRRHAPSGRDSRRRPWARAGRASHSTAGNRPRARSTVSSTSSSNWNSSFSAWAPPRASSSRPAMSPRISCDSRWRSSSRRRRCSGSSSMSPRRTSMFVCRLVSGVRSSCEASATKRRCVSSDSSSAASIVLNEAPSARELVVPALGDALARLARLGDPLGRGGQAAHRSERRARDDARRRQPRRRSRRARRG